VTAAYAAAGRAQMAILATLNTQIKAIQEQVEAQFGQHPDAEIYLSQPGLGVALTSIPGSPPWPDHLGAAKALNAS
jgi:transposase